MKPIHYLIKRTFAANPIIKKLFKHLLKMNIVIHNKTTDQFIQFLDFIILYLDKELHLDFKTEIINEWIKIKIFILLQQEETQITYIEKMIDGLIFVDELI